MDITTILMIGLVILVLVAGMTFALKRNMKQTYIPASAFLDAGASPRVAALLARGNMPNAVQTYQNEQQVGMRESKDAIHALLTKVSRRPSPAHS